ncbi:MAG: phage portal protein [Rikenellaceae bacterium]
MTRDKYIEAITKFRLDMWTFDYQRQALWRIFTDARDGNGTVSAIVTAIADACVDLMEDVEIVDANGVVVDNEQTQQIWSRLRKPNADQRLTSFVIEAIENLLVVGDGFIYRLSQTRPALNDIRILPSAEVEIKVGKSNSMILGYDIVNCRTSNTPRFSTDEVLMFKRPSSSTTKFYGRSPLTTILKDIDTMDSSKRLQNMQIKDGGVRNILFPRQGELEEKEDENVLDLFMDTVRSIFKRDVKKNTVIDFGLEQLNLGDNAVSLGVVDAISMGKEDVCNAYHYPMDLLKGESTFSNQKEARLREYSISISHLKIFLEGLEAVFNMYDMGLEFKISKSRIAKLHQDLSAEMNARDGIATINEKRALVGYEPRPDGDVLMIPLNQVELEQSLNSNLDDSGGQ